RLMICDLAQTQGTLHSPDFCVLIVLVPAEISELVFTPNRRCGRGQAMFLPIWGACLCRCVGDTAEANLDFHWLLRGLFQPGNLREEPMNDARAAERCRKLCGRRIG